MPIVQSCCCWRSLRRGCYASAAYTLVYYTVVLITMGCFIRDESLYLSGEMEDPQTDSILQPNQITYVSVSLNVTLFICSSLGLISSFLLIIGLYKDQKYLLLPWVVMMGIEILVETTNLFYILYLQIKTDFNPLAMFLFTLDFFVIALNIYAMVCVISQFQEYSDGRGTAEYEFPERLQVQFTEVAVHNTLTTSSGPSRRRSTGRPAPSRIDMEEFSEAQASTAPPKMSRSGKKHVQFPDEQTCIDVTAEISEQTDGKLGSEHVMNSLWMEVESEIPIPEP